MAKKGFTADGVTEEGAESGCGMARVCRYTLPPLKHKRKGWINAAGPTLSSTSQEWFRLKLSACVFRTLFVHPVYFVNLHAGINPVTQELALLTLKLTNFLCNVPHKTQKCHPKSLIFQDITMCWWDWASGPEFQPLHPCHTEAWSGWLSQGTCITLIWLASSQNTVINVASFKACRHHGNSSLLLL